MTTIKEMSGPLFSIDDEDSQFNSIEEIYNYLYTYWNGCHICIRNNVDSNAYILINDIKLPKFLIVVMELKDFEPTKPLNINTKINGIKLSKNFLKQ